MIPVLGIVLVFGAVVWGFSMSGGNPAEMFRPAELVIICGSALGSVIAANPAYLLRKILRSVVLVVRGPPAASKSWLTTLVMLHALFDFARRHGTTRFEEELDHPDKSTVFITYAALMKDSGVADFIRDTLRMATMGTVSHYDLDQMLNDDIEIRRRELSLEINSLATLADSLPGLGIIAAVLGVIVTMGSLKEPPSVIGQKVATALIGTFLGILLSYGVVTPLAANLDTIGAKEVQYYETLRAGLMAFVRGMPPSIAVECARRSIPPEFRPEFERMESACKAATALRRMKPT